MIKKRKYPLIYSTIISLLLLCLSSAFGFQVSETSSGAEIMWNTNSVTYYINPAGGPSNSISAINAAAQTWSNVSTSSFTFVYGGTTSNPKYGENDSINTVSFGPMNKSGVVGESLRWYNTSTGKILDADMRFNTKLAWATNGSSNAYDVQNIATHEFGHYLSLDDLYASLDSEKTMYGYTNTGETKRRTLEQDDIHGISYLYPQSQNYSLNLIISPSGAGTITGSGINCPGICSLSLTPGAQVSLTASTNPGYEFSGWNGCNSTSGANCYVTMTSNKTVAATFTKILPDLTGQWMSLSNTCKNTKKGVKCSLKGKMNVQNVGIKNAPSSIVRYYLSENNTYDGGDIFLKNVSTGTIQQGKGKAKTFSNSFSAGITTGGKYVIAVIDADNTVEELNEANNYIVYGPFPGG
jgi:hypothetical protein